MFGAASKTAGGRRDLRLAWRYFPSDGDCAAKAAVRRRASGLLARVSLRLGRIFVGADIIRPPRFTYKPAAWRATIGRPYGENPTRAQALPRTLPYGGAPRIFNSSRAISPKAKPLDRFASKRPLQGGSVQNLSVPIIPFGARASKTVTDSRRSVPLTNRSRQMLHSRRRGR